MSGGGIFLAGEWLSVGSRVVILREGRYQGMCGLFKGKGRNNKLLVNVVGATAIKLHLTAAEIRRAERVGNAKT